MNSARITGLWIYPVKSCQGISVTEMKIGPAGPLHDREWLIVDEQNKFITLRTQPRLAEIKTALQDSFLQLYLGPNKIIIDLNAPSEARDQVTIWNDSVEAGVCSHDINEAISDFLNQSVKLVRYDQKSFRELKAAGTSEVNQTRFTDSRPVLLTNKNSLDELNRLILKQGGAGATINRFRSNIIIDGLEAFAEDQIKEIHFGEVKLQNAKPCSRCVIITQDVESGHVVSKETLKTLANFRREQGAKVTFGTYFTPGQLGRVRVGEISRHILT
ncbi:MAG: MOSC N-terminal beta barrel domain-containing protein [Bdellovibrionaceae bacterium]|nr:MOSC N-terminal beta barrel domain-containing protein [Bdellovibrio sp.]